MSKLTIEQFWTLKLWEDFSKSCKFRVEKGFHYPEDDPFDACVYTDEKTGGGVYTNCCFTACLAWLDQLSPGDKARVLAEMEEGERWLAEQEAGEANESWKPICVFQDGSYPCYPIEDPNCELCYKIHKAGIREVVDWIENHSYFDKVSETIARKVVEKLWQAKLKEWGIEEAK